MNNFKEVLKGIVLAALIALGAYVVGSLCSDFVLELGYMHSTIPFGVVNLLWCKVFILSLLLIGGITFSLTAWICVVIKIVYDYPSKQKKQITN